MEKLQNNKALKNSCSSEKIEKINKSIRSTWLLMLTTIALLLTACGGNSQTTADKAETLGTTEAAIEQSILQGQTGEALLKYEGKAFEYVNGNVPAFSEEELTTEPFEIYSELDELGRCGVAYANICEELMPTEERESIGMVKPTGWQTAKYQGLVDGNYLYNRCHLIGFQLAGENANEKNLITGTRFMNVDGMLPFENMIADFVKDTGYHVLYRVTPVFEGSELVARGVLMEAESVEDRGEGLSFNVYVYNVQPGVIIDYKTGNSSLDKDYDPLKYEEEQESIGQGSGSNKVRYVINTNSNKFHLPSCDSVKRIRKENKKTSSLSREILIERGYSPCGSCKP